MKANKALLTLFLLSFALGGFAQKTKSTTRTQKETVVIKKQGNTSTTIEINDGGVFLDGERIATREDLNNRNISKKIIIKDGVDNSSNFPLREKMMGGNLKKALLGVYTGPSKTGEEGAYLESVSAGSAAEDAGLREGDLITAIDSNRISGAEDLTRTIRDYDPGETVKIKYIRNGKQKETRATLKEKEDGFARLFDFDNSDVNRPFIRMAPQDMMSERKPKLGVSVEDYEKGDGARIIDIKPGSPADAAGLKNGDIITSIENDRVSDAEELAMIVRSLDPGDKISVEVKRDGERMTRMVALPKLKNSKDL
jgi:serine protease Do